MQNFDIVLALDDTFALDQAGLPILVERMPLQRLGQPQLLGTELVQDVPCPDHQDVLVQVEVHDGEELLVEKPRQVVVVVVAAAAADDFRRRRRFSGRRVGQLRVSDERVVVSRRQLSEQFGPHVLLPVVAAGQVPEAADQGEGDHLRVNRHLLAIRLLVGSNDK